MDFYSVDILENQVSINNIIRYIGMFLLFGLIILIIVFLKKRFETKYRDLAVIAFLSLLLISCMQYMDYSQSLNQKHQVSEVLNFINVLSEKEKIDKDNIYINSYQLNDNTIIKLNESYYSVELNADKSAFSLKKVTLLNGEIIKKD